VETSAKTRDNVDKVGTFSLITWVLVHLVCNTLEMAATTNRSVPLSVKVVTLMQNCMVYMHIIFCICLLLQFEICYVNVSTRKSTRWKSQREMQL
jgi:hypothetical protein